MSDTDTRKFKCLTCGARRSTKREIDNHVVAWHLPVEWEADDLINTSEIVAPLT
jgi:hypothetical protein